MSPIAYINSFDLVSAHEWSCLWLMNYPWLYSSTSFQLKMKVMMLIYVLVDVPNTEIILRKHGLSNNLFSCLLYNELEAFNPRDQLPFAYVRDLMSPKLKLNMFEEEVLEQIAAEYRHNLNRVRSSIRDEESYTTQRTKRARSGLIVNSSCCSRCQNYLSEVWDETHKWF